MEARGRITKNVSLDYEVWKVLHMIKLRENLPSLNEVIRYLLRKAGEVKV